MSKSFTPGPWHVGESAPCIVYAEDGWAVCNAVVFHNKADDPQANARLIAAAPDHALVARALAAGVARWELFTNAEQSGELCIGGMRYVTQLDEFGVPELSDHTRHALAAGTGSAS